MFDLIYAVLALGAFAMCGLAVRGCARI